MTTATVPKFERVRRALAREIESGRWEAGTVFPSEAQLLERFEVSRPTLVRSLRALVDEGYLYRQQGKGTFVADRGGASESSPAAASPFTVFLASHVARMTGSSREVQLNILRGIQDALGASYNASVVREASSQTLDAETRRFIEASPPGIALIIEPSFNTALPLLLEERGWTVWAINEMYADGNFVSIDQEQAGYLATRFLLDEGRQRVALVNGPEDMYWGFAARRAGYERALREAGLDADPALIRQGASVIDSETGRTLMRELLELPAPPDGVVGASDGKAIGAMAHAIDAGFRVPEQIAFVGIDNTLASQAAQPLPAVAMPFREMGFQAAMQAKWSAQRKGHAPAVHTHIKLQPTLVER